MTLPRSVELRGQREIIEFWLNTPGVPADAREALLEKLREVKQEIDKTELMVAPLKEGYDMAPVMARQRGNPNWGKPMAAVSGYVAPTEFERLVKHLRLTPDMYAASHQLRKWCLQNSNRHYIPEWLLKEWGIAVEISHGVDAA